MRTPLTIFRLLAAAVFITSISLGQDPSPAVTPSSTPGDQAAGLSLSPSPGTLGSPAPGALGSPNPEVTAVPAVTPPPNKANEPSAIVSTNTFRWSEAGAPVFTLDE